MITVTDLQTRIQFWLRDNSAQTTFTAEPNIATLNMAQRRMGAMFPWPELTVAVTPAGFKTTANLKTYTLPQEPKYIDLRILELQYPDDNSNYWPIPPARDESLWSRAGRMPASFPQMYRIQDADSSTFNRQLEVRPAPLLPNLQFKMTGIVEPHGLQVTTTATTTGGAADDLTCWRTDTQDDLLAMIVAGIISDQRGESMWADSIFSQAAVLFQTFSGTLVKPSAFREMLGLQPNLDAA